MVGVATTDMNKNNFKLSNSDQYLGFIIILLKYIQTNQS